MNLQNIVMKVDSLHQVNTHPFLASRTVKNFALLAAMSASVSVGIFLISVQTRSNVTRYKLSQYFSWGA